MNNQRYPDVVLHGYANETRQKERLREYGWTTFMTIVQYRAAERPANNRSVRKSVVRSQT